MGCCSNLYITSLIILNNVHGFRLSLQNFTNRSCNARFERGAVIDHLLTTMIGSLIPFS
jgi:hypothetical protein